MRASVNLVGHRPELLPVEVHAGVSQPQQDDIELGNPNDEVLVALPCLEEPGISARRHTAHPSQRTVTFPF